MPSVCLRTLFVVVVVVGSAACADVPHASLSPLPGKDAALADRAQAYEALRPRPRVSDEASMPSLEINDGSLIFDASDLVVAVDAQSPTAQHAERAASFNAQWPWWSAAGGALAIGGFVGATAYGLWLVDKPIDSADPVLVMLAVGGIPFVAATACGVVSGVLSTSASNETEAAFRTYDGDLRARLALVAKPEALAAQWQSPP
jgi:hypothetical protein